MLSKRHTGTFWTALAFCTSMVFSAAEAGQVQSQGDISERVEAADPQETAYVKDQPILGWRLDARSVDELPGFIREHLGEVDETDYDASYLEKNRGSVVALQMTDDGPDFYVVGKSSYEASYTDVPLAEVAKKNAELMERLGALPELQARLEEQHPNLVGVLKTTPVTMIAMSDIGYAQDDEVTIDSPWGQQTKPAGRDAFLVYDDSKAQYYMVNSDDDGLPISYVPAE